MKGLPLILRGGMGAVAPGFGMAANIIENLGGKASALGGLLKDEFSAPIQNIKDTLMDMAIYSLITMILYEEEEEKHDKDS